MKSQKWMSINFFLFFFTWGVFLPYFTGWLTSVKGLTIAEASIVMGSGMLARAFSTFLLFPIATSKASLQIVMRISAIFSLIVMSLFSFGDSFTMLLAISVLFSIIYPNLLPAMESSASLLMQHEKLHYGKSRSFGSLGYTIALLTIGLFVNLFGDEAILWVMIAGLAFFTFMQLVQTPAVLKEIHRPDDAKGTSSFKELFTSTSFVTVLLLAILLQGAHASYYNFGYIYLIDLQVSGIVIGIILNIAVVFEIFFFMFADRLLRKTSISSMFLLAAIGSTLRWIVIFFFPTIFAFVLSQLLHMVSFGLAHYAFIQFITKRLDRHLIATAQGLYAALAMSLSTAILTFAGGYLYDISPGYAFLGMTICTIPAIGIVLFTKKKWD
ncbi:3-phenylpropionate MFS transporter [Paenisporosarcina cavernae]|uniref:3-phenylpropionate MFS transporter n=1 Tax=Paenisporosarcina cavernae TaxID=2320858 RepID=A0A385YV79_9BACL|nr:3-phenylpropionate MFS transporter [Paenisporosarcina cavernae]AYC30381.1 3-phenylpropionate MFS transporter [Paenisporosarcina cavernae]